MKTAISPWHDTLGQALDAGISEMQSRGAVLLNEAEMREAFAFGGVKYNETKNGTRPARILQGQGDEKICSRHDLSCGVGTLRGNGLRSLIAKFS
jgi:hypothetical protein